MGTKRRAEAAWIESRERWQINVQRDGKRKTFTSTIPGRKGKHAAEAKADDWLDAGQPDSIRFDSAWETYTEHLRRTTGKLNHTDNVTIGKNWMLPSLGKKRLEKIKLADLQAIINDAADQGRAKRTCKNIKDKMAGFFAYASDNGWEHVIDCGKIKIPSSAKESEKTVIQPEDLRKLFAETTITRHNQTVQCHYIYAFQLLVCLGLRSGELCGLKVADYDGTTLTINRAINRLREVTPGKTKNARRAIVVPQRVKAILQAQADMLKQQDIRSQWLFPDTDGHATNPNNFYRRWHAYATQHGITVSIHELRHTFISMTNKDLPESLLKQVVGHSSAMPTDDVYGHEIDGDKQRAADIIDAVLSKHLDG
jgi:integrase